ncbi:hypothetical protein HDF17_002340 [Granulicella arctica]|uniref:Uncharacterized protein n=1 Tax=Granulicella arctica TaxID=940613 RepID=A0A7Y9THL8_9BACT|nr:hypothetical protein [Granulicella arctica]
MARRVGTIMAPSLQSLYSCRRTEAFRELIPQEFFFTLVLNHGILDDYISTVRLATGVYQTVNNLASLPSRNPQFSSATVKR